MINDLHLIKMLKSSVAKQVIDSSKTDSGQSCSPSRAFLLSCEKYEKIIKKGHRDDAAILSDLRSCDFETKVSLHHELHEFQVMGKLGEGKYGMVLLAYLKNSASRRLLAIKCLSKTQVLAEGNVSYTFIEKQVLFLKDSLIFKRTTKKRQKSDERATKE